MLMDFLEGSGILSVENLIAPPFSPSRKTHFLGRLQPLRIGFLYLMSGFGGSLLSALFIQYGISVGASGATFGLLGSMLSELFIVCARPFDLTVSDFLSAVSSVAYSPFHHLNKLSSANSTTRGQLCSYWRFLLGFLFLIRPQFKWLTQRNAPLGRVTTPVKSKHKKY